MNLTQMKYAMEVARTGSITSAAQALYMGQPALSRAIKELEDDIGIKLFKRSQKGIVPTSEGEQFLAYAASILDQVARMESLYKKEENNERQVFSVSVPRASYVAQAFRRLVASLDGEREMDINYKETNAFRAINNIVQNNFRMAIIRYQTIFEPYFVNLLKEKDMYMEEIWTFEYAALMSRRHPLAEKKPLTLDDLAPYTRVMHGDPYVPSLPVSEVKSHDQQAKVMKRIYIYERASQFELLSEGPEAYMWVSPVPQQALDRYHLFQRRCVDADRPHRDVLVYRKGYRLTDIDWRFIEELHRARDEVASLPVE
ncbi:MAG: LysR family transcriptional regulator [Clostridia bacterium]|nr:LysR family transcriptional regulator [Clostridia bacterium]